MANAFGKTAAGLTIALATSFGLTVPAWAAPGDQTDAEQAVTAIYDQVQRRCTPSMPPQLQSITWDSFNPASGGTGHIHDANPALGGSFTVAYWNEEAGPAKDSPPYRAYGQWGVNLEFC